MQTAVLEQTAATEDLAQALIASAVTPAEAPEGPAQETPAEAPEGPAQAPEPPAGTPGSDAPGGASSAEKMALIRLWGFAPVMRALHRELCALLPEVNAALRKAGKTTAYASYVGKAISGDPFGFAKMDGVLRSIRDNCLNKHIGAVAGVDATCAANMAAMSAVLDRLVEGRFRAQTLVWADAWLTRVGQKEAAARLHDRARALYDAHGADEEAYNLAHNLLSPAEWLAHYDRGR